MKVSQPEGSGPEISVVFVVISCPVSRVYAAARSSDPLVDSLNSVPSGFRHLNTRPQLHVVGVYRIAIVDDTLTVTDNVPL